ncbi:MAG: DUF2306 domain-containing protein [Ferruginibacter sp.]
MLRTNSKHIINWTMIGLLGLSCYLMLRITFQYMPVQTDVAFLQIKQQYIDIDVWFASFYIHVYTSIFALIAGFTQFSRNILKRNKQLHRSFGYVYIIVVLFISGPASVVMGWYANGGISSRIGFLLLSVLWMFFTAKAFQKARQKNFNAHRNFMIRSYALTLSAISLRAWKYAIVYAFEPGPMDVYRIVAWLGWTGNLLIAEYIIRKRFSGSRSAKNKWYKGSVHSITRSSKTIS